MIASGIALAFNRKAAESLADVSTMMPVHRHALAPLPEPCKSELAAMVDLPEHMDHWFRECSPRNEPMLITCAVPRLETRKLDVPSPSSSPSVLSSGQLRVREAMSKAQQPGPAARLQHSLPQQVPGKHVMAESKAGERSGKDVSAAEAPSPVFTPPQLLTMADMPPDSSDKAGTQAAARSSPSSVGGWPGHGSTSGTSADSEFAPQSPYPHHRRGNPARTFSEDDWSPGADRRLSESASDTSSEAVFDMSKSGSETSSVLDGGECRGVGRSESAASLDYAPALARGADGAPAPAAQPPHSGGRGHQAGVPATQPRAAPADLLEPHVGELEALVVALRAQLAAKDREQQRMQGALTRKSQECENLTHVVRELTKSRCKLVGARTVLGEALAELQHDHARLARITDLSRTVSRENLAKATAARLEAKRAEENANAHRRVSASLRAANSQLARENDALRERMAMLSHCDSASMWTMTGGSTCMRAFMASRELKETY